MNDAVRADDGSEAPTRLLTVGIPVYNGRALLRSCLQSVVASTLPHERYEILVADDGSSEPETLAILAELEHRWRSEPGFVRVLRLGANSGGAARPRNRILDEATGEYVFFVDADDTIGSEALARIADVLAHTPADWVALHQVLVNGRVGAASVRQPLMDVPRLKALTTLTVHKVFRRAEIERQRLRFDEGLPSGQDISFAFSYLVNASRFLMLGSYDYYFLTRHADDPNEPRHLSRLASTATARIEKNHRILSSMLRDLRGSDLSGPERRTIVTDVVLPRVLIRQRYLAAIAGADPRTGRRALLDLATLLTDPVSADPLLADLDPGELTKDFTPEHLTAVLTQDLAGLRRLTKQAPPPPKARAETVRRWVRRHRFGRRWIGLRWPKRRRGRQDDAPAPPSVPS